MKQPQIDDFEAMFRMDEMKRRYFNDASSHEIFDGCTDRVFTIFNLKKLLQVRCKCFCRVVMDEVFVLRIGFDFSSRLCSVEVVWELGTDRLRFASRSCCDYVGVRVDRFDTDRINFIWI